MTKTPAKKTSKKASAAKSAAPKKPATPKKAAPKKTTAKKVAAKKVTVKKAAPKKAAAPKSAPKKAVPKKVPAKVSFEKSLKTAEVKAPKVMDPGMLLALTVAQGMYEKKAEKIRILDMRKIKSASADYFVISHATSDKQVEAIAKSVEEEVKKRLHENPLHREGYENMEWILLDYFNVVAHVFQEEKRDFYGIEQLWGDATDVPFKGK